MSAKRVYHWAKKSTKNFDLFEKKEGFSYYTEFDSERDTNEEENFFVDNLINLGCTVITLIKAGHGDRFSLGVFFFFFSYRLNSTHYNCDPEMELMTGLV